MKAVVAAVAALSPLGHDWRGLGRAVTSGARLAGPVPPGAGAVDPRQRKLMSRAAELHALALRRLLAEAGWGERREEIGLYLGVGASGGDMRELAALLEASRDGEALSLARLGREGLAACTPLLAFQLMNNFTLCHAAIQEGLGGPNAAFFSRGSRGSRGPGTTMALVEALAALAEGDCDRVVAGGADDALHPVTAAELVRGGDDGPRSEAAALLALRREGPGLATIEASVDGRAPASGELELDVAAVRGALGEALAATPALAWAAAVDLVTAAGGPRRVLVTGEGCGRVLVEREGP